MKITGWIIIILGALALLGCLLKGSSIFGPLIWLGIGIYLIHRAKEKEREKQEFINWNKQSNEKPYDGTGIKK